MVNMFRELNAASSNKTLYDQPGVTGVHKKPCLPHWMRIGPGGILKEGYQVNVAHIAFLSSGLRRYPRRLLPTRCKGRSEIHTPNENQI